MPMRVAALLASLLVFALAHGQTSFPDIPERHWAEESVERLADLGILVGYPDGTFRGNESITRFEAALLIDRLLTAVRDDSDAADAAILDQLGTLRAVVMALADETAELQRRVGANREALAALWAEVLALREELDLPPPAPLAPYPPAAPEDEGRAPTEEPDAGVAPLDEPAADAVPDDAEAQEPGGVPAARDDGAAEDMPLGAADPQRPASDLFREGDRTEESPIDEDPADEGGLGDVEPPLAVRQPTSVYASLAGGGAVPRRWLVRATVGVENLMTDRFGARLSLDLGRRSPTPLASVSLLGHATYRLAEPDPVGAYVGAGAGVHFGGDGVFASGLVGGTWSALDPVLLFAEATLDVYLASTLPTGGARFGPTVAVGARFTF